MKAELQLCIGLVFPATIPFLIIFNFFGKEIKNWINARADEIRARTKRKEAD